MIDSNEKIKDSKDLTLKELILKLKEFLFEILNNWKLILLIMIPIISFYMYRTFNIPNTYTGKLTFMINDSESDALGALGGLVTSFGLGKSNQGEYNLEKMQSLLKSRQIIQKGLFRKVEIEGKTDFFANHIIKYHDVHEDWRKIDSLNAFYFKYDDFTQFSKWDNKALKYIKLLVVGSESVDGMLNSSLNENTGIITLSMESEEEYLAIDFLNVLFDELSEYYIEKTIEKQKITLQLTEFKRDSLRASMDILQSKLLNIKDTHRGISLKKNTAEELKLERDYKVGMIAYGEAVKNYELADFILKSKTPFIQPIDRPLAPLRPNKTVIVYIIRLIISGFLSFILAIFLIICLLVTWRISIPRENPAVGIFTLNFAIFFNFSRSTSTFL